MFVILYKLGKIGCGNFWIQRKLTKFEYLKYCFMQIPNTA